MRYRIFYVFCFFMITFQGFSVPIDSLKSVNIDSLRPKTTYKIIPRQATIKSMMIPGWGQIYNRQYWKLPLVAGAFITLGMIANYNQVRYTKYRSYYYVVSVHPEDPNYRPPATVAVPYEDGVIRELDVNQLKRINDGFRRNRDFTYIGMALAWGLNIVDANVSAHLKTFDVSDDLSLRLKPIMEIDPLSQGFVSGLTLSFNFKK